MDESAAVRRGDGLKTMIYVISFSELYGDDRRAEYEFVLQPKFTNLTARLVNLRYDVKNKTLAGAKL